MPVSRRINATESIATERAERKVWKPEQSEERWVSGKTTLPALGHIGPEVKSFYSVDVTTLVYSLEPSRRARRTAPGQLTLHTP